MCYEVLVRISPGYPSVTGRLHTRYSPVRRSPSVSASWYHVAPRLACVRPVASVHPEPGSNSSLYISFFLFLYLRRTPGRIDFVLSFSLVLHLLLFSLVNELCPPSSLRLTRCSFEKRCKGRRFYIFPPNFLRTFLCYKTYFSLNFPIFTPL